jgi:ketosteroid isomerase-like protein
LSADVGLVLPAGSDAIRGRDAIQKFWQSALDSGIAGVGLKTVEIFGQSPTVTEVGQYELSDKTGKVLDHGKYIVIWRREGGHWKLLRDMFSTNVTAPKR